MKHTLKRVFALVLALMMALPTVALPEDVDLLSIAGENNGGDEVIDLSTASEADTELPLLDLLDAAGAARRKRRGSSAMTRLPMATTARRTMRR